MERKLLVTLVTFALSFSAHSSAALSLDEAKQRGFVGETPSGYLDIVSRDPKGEAETLKEEINRKRRKQYEQIAKQNGTPISAVEALAGEKAISNTAPGNFIKLPSGSWGKK